MKISENKNWAERYDEPQDYSAHKFDEAENGFWIGLTLTLGLVVAILAGAVWALIEYLPKGTL